MPINGCCCTTTCCATILIKTAHDYVNLQQTDATNWSDSDCGDGTITKIAAVGMPGDDDYAAAYWKLTFQTIDGTAIYCAPDSTCPPLWDGGTSPWTFVSSTPAVDGGAVEALASVTCARYACCDPIQIVDQTTGNIWFYSQTSCGNWTCINASSGSIVKRAAAENSNKFLLTLPNGGTYVAPNAYCPPAPNNSDNFPSGSPYYGLGDWVPIGGTTDKIVLTCASGVCPCLPSSHTSYAIYIPAYTQTQTHSVAAIPEQTIIVTGSCQNETSVPSIYPGHGYWASPNTSLSGTDSINTTGYTDAQLVNFHFTVTYDFATVLDGTGYPAGTTYYVGGACGLGMQFSSFPGGSGIGTNSLGIGLGNWMTPPSGTTIPSGNPTSSYFSGNAASTIVMCSTVNGNPVLVTWPSLGGSFSGPTGTTVS
jgi:hypothetical protein